MSISTKSIFTAMFAVTLTGCSMNSPFVGTSAGPVVGTAHLSGGVHGGQQPITGAAIYLYATGTSGYGSTSQSLLDTSQPGVQTDSNNNGYVTTNSTGYFNIDSDYTCPSSGATVYLLALGGNPGNTSGNANTNIALMATLGTCTFVQTNASTLFVNIDEVTTVASVYALAPFMTSATAIGTSSGNSQGLANAIKTFYNLANISTGLAPGTGQPVTGNTFAGLPSGLTVPTQEINALADILAYCVNSDPASSSNCSTLFSDATPPGGTRPTDTIGATLLIAQNPGNNVSALFSLITGTPPFPTTLTTPNDWTIVLVYSGGGLAAPNNMAIDAAGNCWAANSSAGISIISAAGVRLSGTSGYTTGGTAQPFPIAVDNSSTPIAWVGDNGSGKGGVSAVNLNGTAVTGSPFVGGGITTASLPHGIAIDNSGNIWVANNSGGTEGVDEFGSDGTHKLGPIDVGGLTTASAPYGLAIDSSNTIWTVNRATTGAVVRLNNDGTAYPGSPLVTSTGNGLSQPFNVAFDSHGYGWLPNFGNNSITKVDWSTSTPVGTKYAAAQLSSPAWISVDGLNNIWVANLDSANTSAACISEFSNGGTLLTPVCLAPGVIPGAHGIAIDGSGNLWFGAGNLGEMVGIAAPVITPLVYATTSGKLGQRP